MSSTAANAILGNLRVASPPLPTMCKISSFFLYPLASFVQSLEDHQEELRLPKNLASFDRSQKFHLQSPRPPPIFNVTGRSPSSFVPPFLQAKSVASQYYGHDHLS